MVEIVDSFTESQGVYTAEIGMNTSNAGKFEGFRCFFKRALILVLLIIVVI